MNQDPVTADATVQMLTALAQLVGLSIVVERGLAFVFEHEWWRRVMTREVSDPNDASKTIRQSRFPALKALIALGVSLGVCYAWDFNVLTAMFGSPSVSSGEVLGTVMTGFVVAGGSAGAVAVFQGVLKMDKETRDAAVAARKLEAETARQVTELRLKEAQASAEMKKLETTAAARRLAALEEPPPPPPEE